MKPKTTLFRSQRSWVWYQGSCFQQQGQHHIEGRNRLWSGRDLTLRDSSQPKGRVGAPSVPRASPASPLVGLTLVFASSAKRDSLFPFYSGAHTTHSPGSVTGAPGPKQGDIVSSTEARRRAGQLLPTFLEPEGRGQQEGFRRADGRTSRLYE